MDKVGNDRLGHDVTGGLTASPQYKLLAHAADALSRPDGINARLSARRSFGSDRSLEFSEIVARADKPEQEAKGFSFKLDSIERAIQEAFAQMEARATEIGADALVGF